MIELTDKQIAEYFHRSYTAVDGLWCMKVEEKYGFDIALDIDDEVWKVFPKMQARKLKEFAKLGDGIEALFECLKTKLALDGQEFKAEWNSDGSGFRVVIVRCSGHDIMIRSGREALSPKVGRRICTTEYSVWASEFGDNIRFEQECRICEGAETCIVQFSQ